MLVGADTTEPQRAGRDRRAAANHSNQTGKPRNPNRRRAAGAKAAGAKAAGAKAAGAKAAGAKVAGAKDARPSSRSEKWRFRIAAFAIIERQGQVLLARRRDIGWWNLPGGGLEAGETVEEGLRREVLEEVCTEVELVRLVGVYSKPQKNEVVLTFLCHLPNGQPDTIGTSEEVSEVGWFAPNHLPLDLLPKHRQRVADALLGQREAILRAQRSSTEEDQGLIKGA
jgi:8-oxo-dGTP diphosphatase